MGEASFIKNVCLKILLITFYSLILLHFYYHVNKKCKIIANIFYLFFTAHEFKIHQVIEKMHQIFFAFCKEAVSRVIPAFRDDQKINTVK
jgi:hypothetical protein